MGDPTTIGPQQSCNVPAPDGEGEWRESQTRKQPKKVNHTVTNARSVTVMGINFGRQMASAAQLRTKFKDAIYEEVKEYANKVNFDEEDKEDSILKVAEFLREIKDFQVLGDLFRSKRVLERFNKDTSEDKKDLKFKYVTIPIRLTFGTVRKRIENENWLWDHTSYI